jgi:hypothetical protein
MITIEEILILIRNNRKLLNYAYVGEGFNLDFEHYLFKNTKKIVQNEGELSINIDTKDDKEDKVKIERIKDIFKANEVGLVPREGVGVEFPPEIIEGKNQILFKFEEVPTEHSFYYIIYKHFKLNEGNREKVFSPIKAKLKVTG